MRERITTSEDCTSYEFEPEIGMRYAVTFYHESGGLDINSQVNYVDPDNLTLYVGIHFDVAYYFDLGIVTVEEGEYVPYAVNYPDSSVLSWD